jgi:hypothetical protein
MKTICLSLSLGFLLLFPFVLKAQHKYEREYRIKTEMIPQSAKDFVDSIGSDSKVKWYREISLNGASIEAKFRHNKKKFSVEFDTLGNIQDVEFLIKKSEIVPAVYNKMEHKLESLYQKWKFQKIQKQYIGKPVEIITSINKNQPIESIRVSYEIVLKGKALGDTQLYEITFNAQGELQDILQIIQNKADHLEY